MNIKLDTLSKKSVLKILSEPNHIIENADFAGMDYVECDIVVHKAPSALITKDIVLQTVKMEYCLPVFYTLDKGLELNIWLNFQIEIKAKSKSGYIVTTDPNEKNYYLTLSESSSCIEGLDVEETEQFVAKHLKLDRKVLNKVIGQAFMDYAKELADIGR